MKKILLCFLLFIIFVACQKQVPENKDLNKLSVDILNLLNRTDSLSTAISSQIGNISKVYRELDSLNNQLNIIKVEVAGLKNQLQSQGADFIFLTKKLDSLIDQYNKIVEAINAFFFKILSSPGTLSTGLEVYFPFNNNAKNYIGNMVNSSVIGATLTTDRYDEPNAAYLFNGKSDYIETDYLGILGNAERTLTFWAKLDLSDSINILTKKYNGMAAVSWGPGTDGNRFDGYFNFDGIGPTANIGGSAITYQAPSKLSDNKWHHYVFLISSEDAAIPKINNIRIYQDAVLLTNRLAQYDLTLNVNTKEGDPLKIGKCSGPNDPSFFKGAIDEVRIYSRALSPIEIKYLATH
ncbi:MAG: LamG domain-containing protein [Sediminibacterium sp.]